MLTKPGFIQDIKAFKAQIVILKTEKANNKQINKVVQSHKVIGFCFKIESNKL